MNTRQKIEMLRAFSLFKHVTISEIETLAKESWEKIFPPKTVILSQSMPASAVHFIYKGLIKIYILCIDGKIIPIRVKGPFYIVGEMNLFDEESTATVETIRETHTLVFTKESFKSLILKNSHFAFNLLKILNEKLRAANKQTDEYFSARLRERTVTILKTLAPHFPDNEISLSQEELSFIIGASRARVTEILDEFAVQKLINLSHRKIHLL